MKKIYFFALPLFLSVFMISAVAQPTVVNTQELSMDVIVKGNYDIDSVQYNLDQTLTDLGITSISEAVPVVYAQDGSFTTSSNENSGGFFVGSDNYIENWGAGGVVYITHFVVIDGYVAVGQFPDSLATYVDQSLVFSYGFLANDKVELLNITINVKPKPTITGTIINTQTLTKNVYPNNNYALDSVQFDVAQTLTDLGIGSMDEAMVIAVNEDGTYDNEPDDPSINVYWINRAGFRSRWGSGGVTYSSYGNFADDYIGIGQFPDSLKVGQTAQMKLAFYYDEKIEMVEITVVVIPYVQMISVDVHVKQNYDVDTFQFNLDKTLTDLGIGSLDEATVCAVMKDMTYDTISNENSGGFWLGSDGSKTDWGAGGVVYVTHFGFSDGYAGIGQFPDSLSVYKGQSFTVYYGFLADNNKIELLWIQVNVIDDTYVNPKDAKKQGIMIFNNPVQDELKVAIPGNGSSVNGTLTIYSITGAKVLSKQVTSETETIELGHFSSGIYFLNYDNGKTREAIKFIKQ